MSNFNFLGNFLGKISNFSKDGHDMSNKEPDSLPFGVIAPRKVIETIPDEHYKVNYFASIQTAPMREDNFAELYSNLKAVYVPLSMIWRDYLSLTTSERSTRKDLVYNFKNYFPTFDLAQILGFAFPIYVYSKALSALSGFIPDFNTDSVYTHKNPTDNHRQIVKRNPDSGDLTVLIDIDGNTSLYDPVVLLGARLVLGAYTTQQFVFGKSLYLFANALDGYKTVSGQLICYDILRLLDSLGYGNYIPFFESAILTYLNGSHNGFQPMDDFSGFSCDCTNGGISFNVQPSVYAGKFISDHLFESKKVSLLPLIAYQYYVYSNEVSNYRKPLTGCFTWDSFLSAKDNRALDGFVVDGSDSLLFSINDTYTSEDFSSMVDSFNEDLLELPISILGDKLMILIYLFSLRSPLLDADLYTTMQDSVVYGQIPTVDTAQFDANAIQELADTKALYKLKQDLLRSGVRRDKQFEVMFGVKNDNDLFHQPYVLASDSRKINIQTLINQAETDVAPLGARASRGNGVGGVHFTLDTKDFGYIFFVHYVTCETYYENFGIHRSHQLHPSAWFNPRNNNLGLESINAHSLSLFNGVSAESFNPHADTNLGFSVHDWHLKQETNKVHGLFTNFGFPTYGTSTDESRYYRIPKPLMRGNSIFGGFVPTLIDQQAEFFQTVESLYFNPYMVNNLFVQMVDGSIHGDFSFDQFRNQYVYQVHKVSPMPKLGLIKLN